MNNSKTSKFIIGEADQFKTQNSKLKTRHVVTRGLVQFNSKESKQINKNKEMSRTNFDQLLEAGCHFGHLRRKWNPAMAPYIFMERNGIHIIDLHKTVAKVDEAAEALKQIAKSGKKILFVATKKQAKDLSLIHISEPTRPG